LFVRLREEWPSRVVKETESCIIGNFFDPNLHSRFKQRSCCNLYTSLNGWSQPIAFEDEYNMTNCKCGIGNCASRAVTEFASNRVRRVEQSRRDGQGRRSVFDRVKKALRSEKIEGMNASSRWQVGRTRRRSRTVAVEAWLASRRRVLSVAKRETATTATLTDHRGSMASALSAGMVSVVINRQQRRKALSETHRKGGLEREGGASGRRYRNAPVGRD
jgi:hypothetical protein